MRSRNTRRVAAAGCRCRRRGARLAGCGDDDGGRRIGRTAPGRARARPSARTWRSSPSSATCPARRSASTPRSWPPRTQPTRTPTSSSRRAPAPRSTTRAPRSSRPSCRCVSQAGNPPDIAFVPQPGLLKTLVATPARSSRPRRRSPTTSTSSSARTGRPTAPSTTSSTPPPLGANVKSFVWYSPTMFAGERLGDPRDLGRHDRPLRRRSPPRGIKPWCAGIELR